MKLSELIERLEELQAEFGGDADPEVVCAYQPNYPLTGVVLGATRLEGDEDEIEHEGDDLAGDDPTSVVWIAVGDHPDRLSPYAPRAVYEGV